MKKHYKYVVSGTAIDGQTWEIRGKIECEFIKLHALIMKDTFSKLTGGKAIFGKPGVGCEGPYEINRIFIEQYTQH